MSMAKFFVLKSQKMDFLPTEQNNFFKTQRKPMSTAKFFVFKSQKLIFDPLCKTNFSKLVQILILHLILSLHVYFHQNPWKNDEVRGVFVLKISKNRFLTHCAKRIFQN